MSRMHGKDGAGRRAWCMDTVRKLMKGVEERKGGLRGWWG